MQTHTASRSWHCIALLTRKSNSNLGSNPYLSGTLPATVPSTTQLRTVYVVDIATLAKQDCLLTNLSLSLSSLTGTNFSGTLPSTIDTYTSLVFLYVLLACKSPLLAYND
jgi:hypothetical protein